MAMEMRAGMPLCHTPAGMTMVRILIRTERAHLLRQKLLFFFLLKEWLLYMILDTFLTAGGNIPTKNPTNNSLKLTTPSSNGTMTSHIHDCITFWCAHNFTSWHCIIVTPGMISTMHVYYLTSPLHIDSDESWLHVSQISLGNTCIPAKVTLSEYGLWDNQSSRGSHCNMFNEHGLPWSNNH